MEQQTGASYDLKDGILFSRADTDECINHTRFTGGPRELIGKVRIQERFVNAYTAPSMTVPSARKALRLGAGQVLKCVAESIYASSLASKEGGK